MKIAFFYECGKIKEVGAGHKYRSISLATELRKRGHRVEMPENQNADGDQDVLVVDHVFSQKDLICSAKERGTKVVLVDGAEQDVGIVDESVSCFFNKKAKHTGIRYAVVPRCYAPARFDRSTNDTVFVSCGGFDAGNYTEMILNVLQKNNFKSVVTAGANNKSVVRKFNNAVLFEDDYYYDAMNQCGLAITNGGLTLFQALHFGMPIIAVPQYEYQKDNIDCVSHCCLPAKPNAEDIEEKLKWLESRDLRRSLGDIARGWVDGQGIDRVCDIIEGL
jgi:spore coat polysaccharide biosynthesis predicted glycosyltransferase SpsG